MKNWRRVILVCFVLVGGTAFFVYYFLNQFNTALDDLSTSSLIIVDTALSDKTNKEQVSTSTPETVSTSTLEITSTSTPETVSTSTLEITSTSTPETVSTSTSISVTSTGL